MHPIYPICHETVYPLIGRQVCAVTHDGTHYYGTISEVRDGRVLLTDCRIGGDGALALSATKTGGKIKKPRQKNKAKISGLFGGLGYGYGFGSYWLPFALLSSLFLLPFFFI